jgi:hypothetical protein
MVTEADDEDLLKALSSSVVRSSSVIMSHENYICHVDEHKGHKLHLWTVRPVNDKDSHCQHSRVTKGHSNDS